MSQPEPDEPELTEEKEASNYPYRNKKYAEIAQKLMDRLQTGKPAALVFYSKDVGNAVSFRNKFYQGAHYLTTKLNPGYSDLRNQIAVRVEWVDNRDHSQGQKVIFDWKRLPVDRSKRGEKEIDIDQLIALGEQIKSRNLGTVVVDGEQLPPSGKPEIGKLQGSTKAKIEQPLFWLDRIVEYVETAKLEGNPLVIEGLELSDLEIKEATALLDEVDDMVFDITSEKIFIHKTKLNV